MEGTVRCFHAFHSEKICRETKSGVVRHGTVINEKTVGSIWQRKVYTSCDPAVCVCVCVCVMGMQLKALCILGKLSTTYPAQRTFSVLLLNMHEQGNKLFSIHTEFYRLVKIQHVNMMHFQKSDI